MDGSFSQFGRVAIFLGYMFPELKIEKREFSKDLVETVVRGLVFLLDALIKGENVSRKKNLILPEGRKFFSDDPIQVMENINHYLQTFNTQVLNLSKTERQTFTFVMDNLIDYFKSADFYPDEKSRKKLFSDYKFWIENFLKIFDQKISGTIVANKKIGLKEGQGTGAIVSGEPIFANSLVSFTLFPYLVCRDKCHLFLTGISERDLIYKDILTNEKILIASEGADTRIAEFLISNFSFSEVDSILSRIPNADRPPVFNYWEKIQSAWRNQNQNLFQESMVIVGDIPFEDFNIPLLYLLQIRNLLNLNRLFEVKRLLQKFLLFYPHYADGHEIMGDIHSQEENFEMALGYYEKALLITQSKGLNEKVKRLKEALEKTKSKSESLKSDLYFDITEMCLHREESLIPRRKELRQMIEILVSNSRRNVLLIGDRGVGKTSLVQALAQKIILGEVPEILKDKKIREINFVSLLTGSKYRGQFEEKALKLFQEFKHQNSILVLEDIHLMMSTGVARGTSLDLVNILKQFLRENSIQVIASTDYEEFKNTIEKDNSLMGYFQKIMVNEMSIEETKKIIHNLAKEWQARENLVLSPSTIADIVESAKRSFRERKLPDSAIMVFERAVSKARLRALAEGSTVIEIREEVVAEVLSDVLNLPEMSISVSLKTRLLMLKETILKRVVGQVEAINRMVSSVITSRLGYDIKKNRPAGVFLFVGPTGVGKTETALVLSEALYGSQDYLIRIDMSEYMERFTYSRFIGAAPGYVGYYDANQLTDKVRQNPYSVVLLDEVEKADSQLLNIFLQVFDAGRLTDARGNVIDFSKTTIIMTSNIGTALFSKANMGYRGNLEGSNVSRAALIKSLKKYFSPEFLNRIDEIIVFRHLNMSDVKRIILIHLQELKRELEREGKELVVRDEVINHIAKEGYSIEYGARNLSRILKKEVIEKIAAIALEKEWEEARAVICQLRENEVEVILDFLKASVNQGTLLEEENIQQ